MGVLDDLFYTAPRPTPNTDALMAKPQVAELGAFGAPAASDAAALKAYAGALPQPTPGVRFAPDPHEGMTHGAAPGGYVDDANPGTSPAYWRNILANPDIPEGQRKALAAGITPFYMAGQAISGLTHPLEWTRDVTTGKIDPLGEESAARSMETAMMFGGGASVMPKPAGSLGIFGGALAKTADRDALNEAKALRSLRGQSGYEGVDKDSILQDTGWFRGLDEKWRHEISDHDATVAPDFASATTVGKALNHPDLYAAYPQLADIGFEPVVRGEGVGGAFLPELNTIRVNTAQPPETVRASFLHELQHAVQDKEGFARGSSPSSLINGFSDYRRTAGEVEARAAEQRMDMTPEQRRASGVWNEEGLPLPQHQILAPREHGQSEFGYSQANPRGALAYDPSLPNRTDEEVLADLRRALGL